MEGDLLSSSGQVRSRTGLVQVWFSLQPKFNSFELDSEVGRLVWLVKYHQSIEILFSGCLCRSFTWHTRQLLQF